MEGTCAEGGGWLAPAPSARITNAYEQRRVAAALKCAISLLQASLGFAISDFSVEQLENERLGICALDVFRMNHVRLIIFYPSIVFVFHSKHHALILIFLFTFRST